MILITSDPITASLQHWKAGGRRGIWFKVNLKDADWVPILARVRRGLVDLIC